MLTPLTPFVVSAFSWVSTGGGIYGITKTISEANPIWLTLVIPVLSIGLFIAPYQLWDTQLKQVEQLEDRLKGKIHLEGVIVPARDLDKTACIRVINRGIEPIINCTGQLTGVRISVDEKMTEYNMLPYPINLRWSPRNQGGERRELTIQRTGDLDVIRINPRVTNELELCDPFGPSIDQRYRIPATKTTWLEVEISSDSTGAVACCCEILLDNNWFAANLTERRALFKIIKTQEIS